MISRARQRNMEIAQQKEREGKIDEASDYFYRALEISPDLYSPLIAQLKERNIQFLVSPYESDAQLGFLFRNNYIDLVITEDGDTLVYGCRRVLFKLDKGVGEERLRLSRLSPRHRHRPRLPSRQSRPHPRGDLRLSPRRDGRPRGLRERLRPRRLRLPPPDRLRPAAPRRRPPAAPPGLSAGPAARVSGARASRRPRGPDCRGGGRSADAPTRRGHGGRERRKRRNWGNRGNRGGAVFESVRVDFVPSVDRAAVGAGIAAKRGFEPSGLREWERGEESDGSGVAAAKTTHGAENWALAGGREVRECVSGSVSKESDAAVRRKAKEVGVMWRMK